MDRNQRRSATVRGLAVSVALLLGFVVWIELHHWFYFHGHRSIWHMASTLRISWSRPIPRVVTWPVAIIAATGWGCITTLHISESAGLKRIDFRRVARRTLVTASVSVVALMLPYVFDLMSMPQYVRRLKDCPGSVLWLPGLVGHLTLIVSSFVAATAVVDPHRESVSHIDRQRQTHDSVCAWATTGVFLVAVYGGTVMAMGGGQRAMARLISSVM